MSMSVTIVRTLPALAEPALYDRGCSPFGYDALSLELPDAKLCDA